MGKPKRGRRSDRQRYSRRDAQYDLDNDEDIALLSKPFEASIKGVIDLMKAFENGTREVQYLLQYECGLLFECRVCRSIFRSIVNFITHKRVYCRGKGPSDSSQTGQSFDEFMKDVQSLVIVQEPAVCEPSTSPAAASTNNNTVTETTNGEKLSPPRLSKRKAFPRKNLIEVLDRLCQKETREMERPVIMTSRDRACVTSVSDPKLQTPVLCLEKIEHTDVAMRQTVTLGPDGKILNDNHDIKLKGDVIDVDNPLDSKCDSIHSEIKNIERLCKPCNIKFSTRKTFRQHIKSKHNSNPSWYLCPDCKSVFSQIYSVHRHLRRFHRKSESQMQKLHGKIRHLPENQLPAAYAASVSNKKPVSRSTLRETKTLVVSQKDAVLESDVFDLCLTEKNTCSGCTRKFDRVASFNTHTQTCPRRLAILNNTKSQHEIPPSMLRHLMRNTGDSFLSRNYLSETVDTKTSSNVTNPQYLLPHPEIADDNSTSDLISTSSDFQNQSMILNHRPRHDGEREHPVKRIEIQLRMDYNKVSIGSSQAQVTASSSDILDTSTIASVRKSPDTVAIDGRIKPEQNELTSSLRSQILSGKEDGVKGTSTNTVKNDKLLKKSINEESTQDPAVNFLEKQSASLASNSSTIQDVLVEKCMQTTVETMYEQTNEDKIMPQVDERPTSNEVVDRPIQNCQKYINIENCSEDVETKPLVHSICSLRSDNDVEVEVEAVISNRPEVITQVVHNRKIRKNKFLRYRCGECLNQFSSLRGGQNHIEKCHTTGKLWRNNARSGVLSSSWTCVSNNSKQCTPVDTCELDLEINGGIIDCKTDQLLSLADPLVNEEPNHPTKCSINIHSGTSIPGGVSVSKQVSKITKAFPPKESNELRLVVNEKETLNINEDSSSVIGLRPKRHRKNSQVNAAANNIEKVVQVTRKPALDDQRHTTVKTARKATKEGKQLSEKEKISIRMDSKRAKLEFLSTQPPDVSSDNDQVPVSKPCTEQVHTPESTSTSSEQVETETKVADKSKAVTEPIKSQIQDNTNIYKNVSKSVIEVIFGSDLSSSMFSSDHFATEEEVTIIEDQISGTFSVDISSTPEKSRDNLNTIQNENEGSSTTKRRISFSLDCEQMSSPDSGQGSSDMVLEACHTAEELLNSTDPNCDSSNTVEDNTLTSKSVPEGLEKVQAQNACPIILLEKLTDHNSVTNTEVMLVETGASSCCNSNSSTKQSGVSSLKTVPPTEKPKLEVNKMSTPGYNISTRKSMRVFDTKPLRRTTSIDADAHCKR